MKAEASFMETDLFSPQDAAALLSIRAARFHRALSPDELLAAFEAQGLMRDSGAAPAGIQGLETSVRGASARR
jgi:hypothetical protein